MDRARGLSDRPSHPNEGVLMFPMRVWVASMLLVSGLAQAQTPEVKVGFICPFSGGSADFGNSARMGAELAVKEINEVGGFLGRPLVLVQRDDKALPDVGRSAAEDLVLKEKV